MLGPSEGGLGGQDVPDGFPASGHNAYPSGANAFFADVVLFLISLSLFSHLNPYPHIFSIAQFLGGTEFHCFSALRDKVISSAVTHAASSSYCARLFAITKSPHFLSLEVPNPV